MILYRWLMIERLPDESNFNILERLAGEGYLQNTQKFTELESYFLHISPFVKVICSLKNLKKLDLYCECERTLEDLARVFQSCSKLTELNTSAFGCKMDEMTEDLIDKLRPGFQRLRRLDILCSINNDSWLGFQKMLT